MMGTAFAALLSQALVLPLAMLWGWAFVKLWAWFIVPLFALPDLTLWPAVGFGLVISFLTHQFQREPDDDEWLESMMFSIIVGILRPLLAVFWGWIVTGFLP